MSRLDEKANSILFCAIVALTCASPSFADEAAAPGPALEARQKLLERIQQARSQGIGIGGYMQAFKALEDQVKAGDPADKIGSRVESIHSAINKQLENGKMLKTQKPLPPQGSQITGGDPIAAPSGSKGGGLPAGLPGGANGEMLEKLKGKLGGKLDNIPDSIKERIMSDPNMMDKIKSKMGGGGDNSPPPAAPPGGAPPGIPGGQAPQ